MVAVPILDPIFGKQMASLSLARGAHSYAARSPPCLFLNLYMTCVITGAWYVSHHQTTAVLIASVLSVGVCAGLAFSAVHELVHQNTWASLAIARTGMVFLCFMHFDIEHVYSHHRFAGTIDDTSSARRGESLYAFLIRSIPAGVVFAWRFDAERTSRRRGKLPILSRNPAIWHVMLPALAASGIAMAFGARSAMFFVMQATVGIVLLMTVAYIQHYGLERAPHERFGIEHAWDCDYRLSNWVNFGVQRHAAHHLSPSRPYALNGSSVGTPSLPGGYPAMIALAMVPPAWMHVMDPRIPERGSRNPPAVHELLAREAYGPKEASGAGPKISDPALDAATERVNHFETPG